MTNGAAVAIAQAIKASGAIFSVESTDFMTILDKVDRPLMLRPSVEIVRAKRIWIPGQL